MLVPDGPGSNGNRCESSDADGTTLFSPYKTSAHVPSMEPKHSHKPRLSVPAVRPPIRKLSPEYAAQTIALWEPRAGRRLTQEDAREIVENVTGFFRILQEWDRAERMAAEAEQRAARTRE